MERIDLRRAKELVIDIVDAAGDGYVYDRLAVLPRVDGIPDVGECRYEDAGKPSCLVGHVLFRAGVPVDTLKILDNIGTDATELSGPICRYGVNDESTVLNFDVTWDAAQMLGKVQGMQDAGSSWGDCARVAREWSVIDCE